jgi:hypothetical protein
MSQQGSNGQDGNVPPQQITWVGMQHLMHGFCGRATDAPPSEPQAVQQQPAAGGIEPADVRSVAVVRTKPRQGRVVRIGPPRVVQSARSA